MTSTDEFDSFSSSDPFDADEFRQLGHELVDFLADFLEQSTGANESELAERVLDFRDENEVYDKWKAIKPGQLTPAELFQRVADQSIRLHHPRFLGHQISPPASISALGGLFSDLLNNGMGVYEMGMAGTAMERIVVEMVAEQFGWNNTPFCPGGVLTSGGSLGNLTALLTARNVKTQDLGASEIEESRPAVLVSEQAHYCVQRAVSIMGWGDQGIVTVPVNQRFQMDTTQLSDCLTRANEAGRNVIAVVGSACSTATGSYDDLNAIGKFCQEHNLWFHVDGAHGGAVVFSEKFRHLIDGIEFADSAVLDFHKLLLTPALATALVFRNGKNGYRTFKQKADYLFSENEQDEQWHDIALRSFECTKLMMSLKVFSIYSQFGFSAWDTNVTRLFDLAQKFADLIEEREELELLVRPESNIVCYRYLAGGESKNDLINGQIREHILDEGRFYIVQTSIDGTHWLRSTIGSVMTTEAELNELLSVVVKLGQKFSVDDQE